MAGKQTRGETGERYKKTGTKTTRRTRHKRKKRRRPSHGQPQQPNAKSHLLANLGGKSSQQVPIWCEPSLKVMALKPMASAIATRIHQAAASTTAAASTSNRHSQQQPPQPLHPRAAAIASSSRHSRQQPSCRHIRQYAENYVMRWYKDEAPGGECQFAWCNPNVNGAIRVRGGEIRVRLPECNPNVSEANKVKDSKNTGKTSGLQS